VVCCHHSCTFRRNMQGFTHGLLAQLGRRLRMKLVCRLQPPYLSCACSMYSCTSTLAGDLLPRAILCRLTALTSLDGRGSGPKSLPLSPFLYELPIPRRTPSRFTLCRFITSRFSSSRFVVPGCISFGRTFTVC
jgi:hypothetical protein